MKQTMKKCLTLLLALALLFTMAVPAAAAPATSNAYSGWIGRGSGALVLRR